MPWPGRGARGGGHGPGAGPASPHRGPCAPVPEPRCEQPRRPVCFPPPRARPVFAAALGSGGPRIPTAPAGPACGSLALSGQRSQPAAPLGQHRRRGQPARQNSVAQRFPADPWRAFASRPTASPEGFREEGPGPNPRRGNPSPGPVYVTSLGAEAGLRHLPTPRGEEVRQRSPSQGRWEGGHVQSPRTSVRTQG